MNSLSFRDNYKSTIVFPNSLWIQYLYPEFFMNKLSFSENSLWIHYFNIFFVKILWIHFQFRKLSVSPIDYVLTIFALNHYESTIPFRENTIHPLSLSRIRNLPPKFTMNPREEYKFTIFFAKSLWIHYLPRINYGFMIFFAKSLWIHYLCCEIILNSLLLMQIHRFFCEFIIC